MIMQDKSEPNITMPKTKPWLEWVLLISGFTASIIGTATFLYSNIRSAAGKSAILPSAPYSLVSEQPHSVQVQMVADPVIQTTFASLETNGKEFKPRVQQRRSEPNAWERSSSHSRVSRKMPGKGESDISR